MSEGTRLSSPKCLKIAKFTPGPWIFYADLPSTEPNWHIVTTANKMRVLANVHIEPGNAMDEANARLIAAAPDMLDALKDCQSVLALLSDRQANATVSAPGVFSVYAQCVAAEAKARAALAKAVSP